MNTGRYDPKLMRFVLLFLGPHVRSHAIPTYAATAWTWSRGWIHSYEISSVLGKQRSCPWNWTSTSLRASTPPSAQILSRCERQSASSHHERVMININQSFYLFCRTCWARHGRRKMFACKTKKKKKITFLRPKSRWMLQVPFFVKTLVKKLEDTPICLM